MMPVAVRPMALNARDADLKVPLRILLASALNDSLDGLAGSMFSHIPVSTPPPTSWQTRGGVALPPYQIHPHRYGTTGWLL